MAISRPPGSTETLYRYRKGTQTIGQSRLGYKLPITYSTRSKDHVCEIDRRPSYASGAIITLPGGSTFRRSTSYSHESWEEGTPTAPAKAGGKYNNRIYDAVDDGYDGAVYLGGFPVLHGKTILDDCRNEVVVKALNKIADSKAQIGENLATLGQTARMFTRPIRSIVDLAKAGRRGEFRNFLRSSYRDLRRRGIAKEVCSRYLEYIYGFQPFMSDAYALHQLMKEQSVEPLLIHGRSSASRTDWHPFRGPTLTSSYSTCWRENWEYQAKAKCRLTARFDENEKFLRSINQLGLLNPASLAWELVPWSFVVDWVLPVGPMLQALSAPAGLRFVDGSISNRVTETHEVRHGIDTISVDEDKMSSFEPMYVPITYQGYQRDALSNWPRPGLWVDQDPLRGKRLFTALALAITNLGKSR